MGGRLGMPLLPNEQYLGYQGFIDRTNQLKELENQKNNPNNNKIIPTIDRKL